MLSDKVAVVTGGSSGIGRGIAVRLAEHGADVVIADVRETPRMGGEPTAEKIESETEATAEFIECDVANPDEIETAVLAATELGGIDIMVNNAAVARAVDMNVDPEEFDDIMGVNLKGVFFGTRIAGEEMADDGGGSIINIASPEGVRAVSQRPVYSSSRGAVPLVTESCAGYFGPDGVRVNTVHPGLVETAMVTEDIPLVGSEFEDQILQQTPLRRLGDASEIGDVVTFLASDMASYVTGAEIVADGGQSSSM
jgi:NAD(P)-dependent dehydrogenase (short-subunit alcohol dehydrogenase family)